MLTTGKNFRALPDKKINILILVLSEKKILNETKNHNPPPPPFKLNGWPLITFIRYAQNQMKNLNLRSFKSLLDQSNYSRSRSSIPFQIVNDKTTFKATLETMTTRAFIATLETMTTRDFLRFHYPSL